MPPQAAAREIHLGSTQTRQSMDGGGVERGAGEQVEQTRMAVRTPVR